MYRYKIPIIAITIYCSLIQHVIAYLLRRSFYTSNRPLFNLYVNEYTNEELEQSLSREIEGLIRKSRDFNLDDDIDQGLTQSIYPPSVEGFDNSIEEKEDSTALDVEAPKNQSKMSKIKPKLIPETFLPSIVQLPTYDDEDWCPDFQIGDFKSPGAEYVEKNNDYILEWANARRRGRGLPPIKVRWKKLAETPYMNDKILNLHNSTEVVISETRPSDGNYTCGNIWNTPELKEEYELVKKSLVERKESGGYHSDEPTFYDKLPRDENGIAIFDSIQDVEKLSFDQVKRELIARGYRTQGSFVEVRNRLLDSFNDPDKEWRIENIVKKKLSKDNMELSEDVRNKLRELEDKENFIQDIGESDDLRSFTDKLAVFSEVSQYYDDPVGYLNLDSGIDIQGLSESEIAELKNAPRIEDLHFHKKMNAPEVDFVDRLEKTFNLEENRPYRPIPDYQQEADIYEMKKKFLDIEDGFHEHNVKMIVERYGVSEAFVVDALSKLGASSPIDPTEPIKKYIDYNSIWDFLEYLNIVDPIDTHVFYSINTLEELSQEYDVSMEDLMEACKKINVKLPYGPLTQLNLQCKSAMLHYLYKKGKILVNLKSNPYENHPFLNPTNSNACEEYKFDGEILSPSLD